MHYYFFCDSAKTLCLWNIWFWGCRQKSFWQINLRNFLVFPILKAIWGVDFMFCIYLDSHRHDYVIIWVWSGMPRHAQSAIK